MGTNDTYKLIVNKDGEGYLISLFDCDDKQIAINHLKELVNKFPAKDGFVCKVLMREERWFEVDIS